MGRRGRKEKERRKRKDRKERKRRKRKEREARERKERKERKRRERKERKRRERKEREGKKGQPSPQGESKASRVEIALGCPEKKVEKRKRRDRGQDSVVSRDLDGTSCPPLGPISRTKEERL